MTWEELVEKAKELGYKTEKNCCHRVGVLFEKNGTVWSKIYDDNGYFFERVCFAKERTPDQMYQIMLALSD